MSQEDLRGSMPEFNDVELEEAMRRQNPQLQLLRKLGVAQMIEQEAGIEIPPFVFEDDPNQPPKADWKRTLIMGLPSDGYFSGKWMLIPTPQLTDKGLFDTTLRITASRGTNPRIQEGHIYTHDTQSVLIEFTQDKHLKVVGNEITFDGDLAAVNDELLARVQVGIKEAFTNPQTKPGEELTLMGAVKPK